MGKHFIIFLALFFTCLIFLPAVAQAADSQVYDQTYGYDAIGNITNKSDQGTYSYAQPGKTNPQAVTKIDDGQGNIKLFEYDANGNLIKETIKTADNKTTIKDLFWDYKNKLIKVVVTNPDNVTVTTEYWYNFSGQRIKQSVTTTTGTKTTLYPFADYEITAENLEKTSIFAGNVLVATAQKDSNTGEEQLYYHYNDHLGGSNIIAKQSGEIAQILLYYPYGEIQVKRQSGDYDSRQKFTGYEFDETAGLYYAKARYYDAQTGRFISEDPLQRRIDKLMKKFSLDPQSFNYYSYARNNPIILIDPGGDYWINAKEKATKDITDNKNYIINAANMYKDVTKEMVASVIYQERYDNFDIFDAGDEALGIIGVDTSIGLGQVKISTAKMLSELGYAPGADDFKYTLFGKDVSDQLSENEKYVKILSINEFNTIFVAAYLQYNIDRWKEAYSNIVNDIGVLATLYNQEEQNAPHSDPYVEQDSFGDRARQNCEYVKSLIK